MNGAKFKRGGHWRSKSRISVVFWEHAVRPKMRRAAILLLLAGTLSCDARPAQAERPAAAFAPVVLLAPRLGASGFRPALEGGPLAVFFCGWVAVPWRRNLLTVLPLAGRGVLRPVPRSVGVAVRCCVPPESDGNQCRADAMLSPDVLPADGDGAGRLAAGFSPSLAKGYLRGDPRGVSMGTSLSVPPPPPPPPPPSQAPPRGFYKPSASESAASFQVAARESTGSSTLVRHWTIAQAEEFQYTNSQLGPSSCAPASVLSALSMIKCLPQSVGERLTLTDGLIRLVRQRSCKCRHGSITADSSCSVPLQQYLISRGECGGGGSVAMIDLVEQLCPTVVGAAVNVGETYPFASDQVVDWISDWMQAGAALTVTSNRQNTWEYLKKNPQKQTRRLGGMPDSWHAQPIIGVDIQKRQVIFANPVKVVSEQELEATLASPATLRVRGNDVLLHCQGVDADKIEQYNWPSASWRQHAVSEQILLLRKHFPGDFERPMHHHRAPAFPRPAPHPCALCLTPRPVPHPHALSWPPRPMPHCHVHLSVRRRG